MDSRLSQTLDTPLSALHVPAALIRTKYPLLAATNNQGPRAELILDPAELHQTWSSFEGFPLVGIQWSQDPVSVRMGLQPASYQLSTVYFPSWLICPSPPAASQVTLAQALAGLELGVALSTFVPHTPLGRLRTALLAHYIHHKAPDTFFFDNKSDLFEPLQTVTKKDPALQKAFFKHKFCTQSVFHRCSSQNAYKGLQLSAFLGRNRLVQIQASWALKRPADSRPQPVGRPLQLTYQPATYGSASHGLQLGGYFSAAEDSFQAFCDQIHLF